MDGQVGRLSLVEYWRILMTHEDKICINCDHCDVIENGHNSHLVCVDHATYKTIVQPKHTCPEFKESMFAGLIFFEVD